MKKRALLPAMGLILMSAFAGARDIPYQTASWDSEQFGNHRAVIRIEKPAEAVVARIPWRRRDSEPEKKGVIVVDATTGLRIRNVRAAVVTREKGEIIFQPATVPGDYWIYYLPYRQAGRPNYPQSEYLAPENTADPEWLSLVEKKARPSVEAAAFQSVDEFNLFWPMETIATSDETKSLAEANAPAPFLLFPEDRRLSIRMTGDLPLRWIQLGPRKRFEAEAAPNEFYAFQAGVWACKQDLRNVTVRFGDLQSRAGGRIPAEAFSCFQTGGTTWAGTPMKKDVSVNRGKIQALWCGVQVPAACPPGLYEGDVAVSAEGQLEQSFRFALTVGGAALADHGDSDPYRMARLRWLDSTLAQDQDIVKPFLPLEVQDRTIHCLGREVELGDNGLPARVRSFFSPANTRLVSPGLDVLAGPMRFVVEDSAGASTTFGPGEVSFVEQNPGSVRWEFQNGAGSVRMTGSARMEMDGFLGFFVTVSVSSETEVNDIRLEIPVAEAAARYMMGLGKPGGFRPEGFQWKWDRTKNQDALWLGDVNAGLQIGLRAENYSRPLNTNFYLSKPLNMPPSWENEGAGGVTVKKSRLGVVLFTAASGRRKLVPGKDLHFDFTLLLTPFKLIDTDAQWATRFFHAYEPLDEAAKTGANTLNIHHANEINPYINYPFLRVPQMKAYIDEAHRRGMRVKIYDTIRELSNRAPELFALKSLGTEIFSSGPGGGYSWLREHLDGNYIAAWFVPKLKDAAIINSGMSRWHNYYIEGLNWVAKNVGIDGLYLDDVAFDRTTMKRVRKVLDRNRPAALIDLHSANQYNPRDGFASSANLYLEHFPYLDRLWFGEYFDYEGMPADYWLVEISGIPFGLMGEMLEGGGNPWRGMVFGMTNRLPWSGRSPEGIWKVWDDFGMAGSEMIGYWMKINPVRTDSPDVLATVYRKKGKAMIAAASWAKTPVSVDFRIEWKALGLDPAKVKFRAPEISGIQTAASFKPGDKIPFEPGKGWILIVE
ncbi:MAG: glycoside hydrolase domain-containing protein [Candidatus Aminicenantales bacterium]